jgi:hypothetical protein
MSIHVFLDNSNIFLGAQRLAGTTESHIPGPAIRVYWRNLFALVEAKRGCLSKVLAGSVPPGNEELWQYAKDFGYNTDLLRRVTREDGRHVEQAVDEMLHLKIANALLDHDPPQTLVLVTGDGKVSDFSTSFPAQAERALRRGWTVEVWSWQLQMSGAWKRLAAANSNKVRVSHLDPFYYSVTFVKGGTYKREDGSEVIVKDRVVSPVLPLSSLRTAH